MKNMHKKALVFGAGGFIGGHLVKRLKKEGYYLCGVDIKYPEYSTSVADEFLRGDLRDPLFCQSVFIQRYDEVYQFAADMGGAGYVFSGNHDADIMHNSMQIHLNVLHFGARAKIQKIFFSSSACVYPKSNQTNPDHPNCVESSVYPADPDSEYGWEKLFSERLYTAYAKNYGLDVKIARFHNIFGPEGAWNNGKEKSIAALCRKVAEAANGGSIDIWGDGKQTRSYLYIDECIEGIRRLMDSDFSGPVNIGSEEMVSIDELATMMMNIAGKQLTIRHVPGPLGVRGRRSDNTLIGKKLHWQPTGILSDGLQKTYAWIEEQVKIHKTSRV
jgi:GDP-D-mannose 3', 5'-epimerase